MSIADEYTEAIELLQGARSQLDELVTDLEEADDIEMSDLKSKAQELATQVEGFCEEVANALSSEG